MAGDHPARRRRSLTAARPLFFDDRLQRFASPACPTDGMIVTSDALNKGLNGTMPLPGAGSKPARYDFRADRVLGAALDYWETARRGRAMPQRRDIDPAELRPILAHLQITEVVGGGSRFRYRLVGTAIVEAFGAEFTGKFVDELVTGARDTFVHVCYRAVYASRRPAFVRSRYLTTKTVDLTANRVLLPLSEDDREVSQILGALTFEFTRPFEPGLGHQAQIDLGASYVDLLD